MYDTIAPNKKFLSQVFPPPQYSPVIHKNIYLHLESDKRKSCFQKNRAKTELNEERKNSLHKETLKSKILSISSRVSQSKLIQKQDSERDHLENLRAHLP
jgi:hypothetical protein